MQNKIVGQESPSEGVQGGWRTCAGTPGFYTWALNVILFCVFAAGWTPRKLFSPSPPMPLWLRRKYVASIL